MGDSSHFCVRFRLSNRMSVTLIASDGVELKVDFEIIKQSKIVAGMLENLQQDNPTDLSDEQIPITNVTSAILKRIIEWCTKHKDDKADDEDENEKEKNDQEVPKWDSDFLKEFSPPTILIYQNYLIILVWLLLDKFVENLQKKSESILISKMTSLMKKWNESKKKMNGAKATNSQNQFRNRIFAIYISLVASWLVQFKV